MELIANRGRPEVYRKPELLVGDVEVIDVTEADARCVRSSILGWAKRQGITLSTKRDGHFLVVKRVA